MKYRLSLIFTKSHLNIFSLKFRKFYWSRAEQMSKELNERWEISLSQLLNANKEEHIWKVEIKLSSIWIPDMHMTPFKLSGSYTQQRHGNMRTLLGEDGFYRIGKERTWECSLMEADDNSLYTCIKLSKTKKAFNSFFHAYTVFTSSLPSFSSLWLLIRASSSESGSLQRVECCICLY